MLPVSAADGIYLRVPQSSLNRFARNGSWQHRQVLPAFLVFRLKDQAAKRVSLQVRDVANEAVRQSIAWLSRECDLLER